MALHQIGGSMEWAESLFEKGQQAVKTASTSVAEATVDLGEKVSVTESEEGAARKTEIGGQTELRFKKKEEEYKEKVRVTNFQKELTQAQREQIEKEARRKSIARQRENVIKTIGGISNLSYENVMDDQGNMRIDVEAWFNKKNSEMQEAELKKQKQTQVKQATGKINYFMQHNMAGERAGGQHVLSAVG